MAWQPPATTGAARIAGLLVVLAFHALVLWGLWQYEWLPARSEISTLLVNLITPPSPEKRVEFKPPISRAQPKPVEKPPPRQIVAEAPAVAATEYVAPSTPPALPQPAPAVEAPAAPPPAPIPPQVLGPVSLGGELAVACPERTPPRYPSLSRRHGEEGVAVVRVELDETGLVTTARVQASSGHERLDEAALAAVRTWRCHPAQRNGQPVRTIALQPFKFVLQGG